jgi:hypothetical protein
MGAEQRGDDQFLARKLSEPVENTPAKRQTMPEDSIRYNIIGKLAD